MKNNTNTNIVVIVTNFLVAIFMSFIVNLIRLVVYIFGVFFSLLSAIFSKYNLSKFTYYTSSTALFGQFELFVFPIFLGYYNFIMRFKKVLYFAAFIIPYFLFFNTELSNESLLLGCIIFTIFLLYNSAKDFLVSSISNDVQNVKLLTQKKLDLLTKIYVLEKSMIEDQIALTLSMEECLSKLSAFEQTGLEVDSTTFDNLLNSTFSESLFDYYIVELKDEFYKDYFFIEENFEVAASQFIEENF